MLKAQMFYEQAEAPDEIAYRRLFQCLAYNNEEGLDELLGEYDLSHRFASFKRENNK